MISQLAPEAKILILNAACLAVAWFGIFPSLRDKTLMALARADALIFAAVLVAVAALFAGRGTGFSLILFETNWFTFWIVTYLAMELPLMLWFCKRHGIDLRGGP